MFLRFQAGSTQPGRCSLSGLPRRVEPSATLLCWLGLDDKVGDTSPYARYGLFALPNASNVASPKPVFSV